MEPPIKKCGYCGSEGQMPTFADGETICYPCMKSMPMEGAECRKEIARLTKQRDELAKELESLMSKLTPQTNGADEQCFTIGLRQQVSFQQMVRISETLAAVKEN